MKIKKPLLYQESDFIHEILTEAYGALSQAITRILGTPDVSSDPNLVTLPAEGSQEEAVHLILLIDWSLAILPQIPFEQKFCHYFRNETSKLFEEWIDDLIPSELSALPGYHSSIRDIIAYVLERRFIRNKEYALVFAVKTNRKHYQNWPSYLRCQKMIYPLLFQDREHIQKESCEALIFKESVLNFFTLVNKEIENCCEAFMIPLVSFFRDILEERERLSSTQEKKLRALATAVLTKLLYDGDGFSQRLLKRLSLFQQQWFLVIDWEGSQSLQALLKTVLDESDRKRVALQSASLFIKKILDEFFTCQPDRKWYRSSLSKADERLLQSCVWVYLLQVFSSVQWSYETKEILLNSLRMTLLELVACQEALNEVRQVSLQFCQDLQANLADLIPEKNANCTKVLQDWIVSLNRIRTHYSSQAKILKETAELKKRDANKIDDLTPFITYFEYSLPDETAEKIEAIYHTCDKAGWIVHPNALNRIGFIDIPPDFNPLCSSDEAWLQNKEDK